MAKKYQVKQEDSFSTIAKNNKVSVETLKSVNPGVQTVKKGQVIRVPKATEDSFAPVFQPTGRSPFAGSNLAAGGININRPAQTNMQQNGPYTGFQTPTSSTYVPQVAGTPRTPNGVRTPNTQTGTTTGYAPTSYMNPNLAQNNQGFLGSSSYLNPAYQTQENTQVNQPPKKIARPQGVFTGDPNDPNTALWRNYWNAAAQNPNSVETPEAAAPFVMTREQIWEMKAQSRRKKMENMSEEELYGNSGGGGGYSTPRTKDEPYQFQTVKTITWGI